MDAQPTSPPFIRWADLEIDPRHLDDFTAAGKSHVEAVMRTEPRVVAFHTASELGNPARVRDFEMHEDAGAYQSHLEQQHFKQFLATAGKMITGRELHDMVPVRLGAKPRLTPLTAGPRSRDRNRPGQLEAYVAAVVLGYEVAGRLSTAMQCGFREKGFHGCIVATFASTAAAARLLKLDVSQATHAIALTATSIGGLGAVADTSVAREYHAGQAALIGVQAAQAAAMGFSADPSALEMPGGFFDVFGLGTDLGAVERDLGQRWSILDFLGIKLVPGGHPHHAVAQAAAQAAIEGDVKPDEVEAIDVARPGYQKYANTASPENLIGMAHSSMFFAAAGVADRDFTWAHATQGKIMDPVIRNLLPKVRMVAPPTENLERYLSGAVVSIRTKDGQTHSATVHAPKGAAALGICWNDVEEKYRTLIAKAMASKDKVDASLRVIRGFRYAVNASELTELLR